LLGLLENVKCKLKNAKLEQFSYKNCSALKNTMDFLKLLLTFQISNAKSIKIADL